MAINLGETAIQDVKLGADQVEKIYLGSDLVWSKTPTPVTSEWGVLSYYSEWSAEWSGDVLGCTIENIDEGMLEDFIVNYGGDSYLSFQYMEEWDPETGEPTGQHAWLYFSPSMGEVWIPAEEFYDTTGIEVTLDDPDSSASMNLVYTITVDTESEISRLTLTQSEYNSLTSNGDSTIYHVGGLDMPNSAVYSFVFGTECTTVPDSFLGSCQNLVSVDMSAAEGLTRIGNQVFYGCASLDSPIEIPDTVTNIGNYFLGYCNNFSSNVTLPSSLRLLGTHFLANSKFNHPVEIPSGVTGIEGGFLYGCTAFNSSITLPNGLLSIGYGFLNGCSAFNQPISLPSGVTVIGTAFLANCSSYTQPLTLPSGLTEIQSSFLDGCKLFNQPLTIPSTVTSIGSRFLANDTSYNQPISIPSGVTTIGEYFLFGCTAFNSSLTLPNSVTTIELGFLLQCTSFNQPFTLPSSLTSVKGNFVYQCDNMTSTINVGNVPATVAATSDYTFSTLKSTARCYTVGIGLTGATASNWKSRFPDISVGKYRKVKVV